MSEQVSSLGATLAERISEKPETLTSTLTAISEIDSLYDKLNSIRERRGGKPINVTEIQRRIEQEQELNRQILDLIDGMFTPAQAELVKHVGSTLPKKWEMSSRAYKYQDGIVFLIEEDETPTIVGWSTKPRFVFGGSRTGGFKKWAQFIRDLASLLPKEPEV